MKNIFTFVVMLLSAATISAESAWCNRIIGHSDPTGEGTKDAKSYVRLTVQDNKNGTITFTVAADPTIDATLGEGKAAPDVDYILINSGYGSAGTDVNADAPTSQSVTWTVPEGTTVLSNVEILWSYSNWVGRYMVNGLSIPLDEICGAAGTEGTAAVTGVLLDKTTAELPLNKTLNLKATVAPSNAGNKNITWTSSEPTVATVADGVVTPVAKGTTTITVTTEEGSFTATCAVTVIDAAADEPTAAPTIPTYPANQVKAIYSGKYSADCNFQDWGSGTQYTQDTYGKKFVTSGLGYLGLTFAELNCATMDTLHADVWVADDCSMRFVPILHRPDNTANYPEQGVTVNLEGGKWNSIDIALNAGDWANYTDWMKVYQLKIDNVPNRTFWVNNIYFYTTQTETDETLKITTAKVVPGDNQNGVVTLELAAEKNGESVYNFLLKDERNNFSRSVTTSSESNTVRLTGLKACTDYHLTVVATGQDNNSSEPVELTFTTLAGNLALGKTCSAGFAEAENTADKAVDGDDASRWSGDGASEEQCWWQVDLGRIYNITEVDIRFANTEITDYTISVSLDGDTWEPVVEKHEKPDNLLMSYEFTAQARYLRISSLQNSMSFYEFEVYGTCDEVLEPGHCVFQGGPGEGLMDEDVRYAFTDGYRLEIWLNEAKDTVIIHSEVYDTDHLAGMIVIHRYKGSEVKESKEVFELYDHQTTEDFHNIQIEIPMEKFLKNFEDNGVKNPYSICITVKFVITGGMRCTSLDYFMLDGSCAERSFIIYHHDDMPSEPEHGALTQFEGGLIMRPIQYKRKFKPGVWETLNLPFEVTKVTVYDPDDKTEYNLYAQYTDNNGDTQEGNFWLRTFDAKASEVMAGDFQPNWQDIRAASSAEALPKKGIPYIMMMPNVGGYYDDKYVIFHGKGSQEIAETYVAPPLPRDDYYSYSGNMTMMPQHPTSSYVLDDKGEYFVAGENMVLYPFEGMVNATAPTIARMPRLGLNKQQNITTDTPLPTTVATTGVVYSPLGGYMGAFDGIDQYVQLMQRLPSGMYVVRCGAESYKMHIAK